MTGFRNAYEGRCAQALGKGWQYETVKLPYTIQHTYLPDFVDPVAKRIVEAKGYFPAEDRRKMLAVKRAHPEWSYELWFTNPEKTISANSKTTYRAWGEKHGFVVKQGPGK